MELYDISNAYENLKDKNQVMEMMKKLVSEKGISETGESLVMIAAKFSHPEALLYLAEQDVELNITDRYEFTPLHEVAKRDYRYYKAPEGDVKKCVEILLENRVSALRKDENEYMTCYHYAGRTGNFEFVEALVGKKLDMTDKNGNTGIHIACDYVRNAMSDLKYKEDYVERATKKYEEMVNHFKQMDMSDEDIEKSLINNRIETPQEAQAVYDAVAAHVDDYYKTVKAFIDGGVDPDEKNDYGKSALDMAVEHGAKKIAGLLSGDDNSSAGMTIHQAVEHKDLEAICALAEHGDDLDVPNDASGEYSGYTPLAIGCKMLDDELVETLLSCGADPNAKDSKAKIALCYLGGSGSDTEKLAKNVLKAFKAHGFDVNGFADDESNTLLTYNCKYYNGGYSAAIIDNLLGMNADINIANRFGETPLMQICTKDYNEVENIQIMMLEDGADVTVKDKNGDTPLHYAAKNRSDSRAKTLCDMLFEFGKVDVNAVNNEGKSALDIATENNNEPLVKYLLGKL